MKEEQQGQKKIRNISKNLTGLTNKVFNPKLSKVYKIQKCIKSYTIKAEDKSSITASQIMFIR
jgi:hypothetical protein